MHTLAKAVGLAREWRDVFGAHHVVAEETLTTILTALGYDCEREQERAVSFQRVKDSARNLPPMLVSEVGRRTPLPGPAQRAELVSPDAQNVSLTVEQQEGRAALSAINEPGYYSILVDGCECTLAVAPRSSPLPGDLKQRKAWGAAVQIPALCPAGDGAFGDLGHLRAAVGTLAKHGAAQSRSIRCMRYFPERGGSSAPIRHQAASS